jgi:hypothetical protein
VDVVCAARKQEPSHRTALGASGARSYRRLAPVGNLWHVAHEVAGCAVDCEQEALTRGPQSMAAGDRVEPLANPACGPIRGGAMRRSLLAALVSAITLVVLAAPALAKPLAHELYSGTDSFTVEDLCGTDWSVEASFSGNFMLKAGRHGSPP